MNLKYSKICYFFLWAVIVATFFSRVYDIHQFTIGVMFGLLLVMDVPNFILSFFTDENIEK